MIIILVNRSICEEDFWKTRTNLCTYSNRKVKPRKEGDIWYIAEVLVRTVLMLRDTSVHVHALLKSQ